MFIANSFSLNMLSPAIDVTTIRFTRVSDDDARSWANGAWQAGRLSPAVGHADTAAVVADILGLPIDAVYARTTVRFLEHPFYDYMALIAQYVGPRLPEGATSLPDGAKIEWFRVEVIR